MKRAPPRNEDSSSSSSSSSDEETFDHGPGPDQEDDDSGQFEQFAELFPELQGLVGELADPDVYTALSLTSRGQHAMHHQRRRPANNERIRFEWELAHEGNRERFELYVPVARRTAQVGYVMMTRGHIDLFLAVMDCSDSDIFHGGLVGLLGYRGCTEALLGRLWTVAPPAYRTGAAAQRARILILQRVGREFPQFWRFFFDPPAGVLRADFVAPDSIDGVFHLLLPDPLGVTNMAMYEYVRRTMTPVELTRCAFTPTLLGAAIEHRCAPAVAFLLDYVEPDAETADYIMYSYDDTVFHLLTTHARLGRFFVMGAFQAAYLAIELGEVDEEDGEFDTKTKYDSVVAALQRLRRQYPQRFPTEDEVVADIIRATEAYRELQRQVPAALNPREAQEIRDWVGLFFWGSGNRRP